MDQSCDGMEGARVVCMAMLLACIGTGPVAGQAARMVHEFRNVIQAWKMHRRASHLHELSLMCDTCIAAAHAVFGRLSLPGVRRNGAGPAGNPIDRQRRDL
ncbi:hypothetical protein Gain_0077_034 [Komagataeibacter intermedius TF2]|uniref:Uncharacterized protein n=2 Tax=Komagataeibacter intermedius TaxID=66229 RepID=A0A0N1N7E0_9PROT|nr:hypothetical protein GLUCOINTEAF2_0201702 [Komagataeibacter intermedius AF2]GAN87694.1 hypothetical protein Gain_0077_034 [Komagataeibacter intermedius TF2]GBQ75491.1 hypothetical protein AA0521_2679 [Komagataeibacter intermedius NRIC 0521]